MAAIFQYGHHSSQTIAHFAIKVHWLSGIERCLCWNKKKICLWLWSSHVGPYTTIELLRGILFFGHDHHIICICSMLSARKFNRSDFLSITILSAFVQFYPPGNLIDRIYCHCLSRSCARLKRLCICLLPCAWLLAPVLIWLLTRKQRDNKRHIVDF